MKKHSPLFLLAILLCVFSQSTNAQTFINGDFELTSATDGVDEINLSNENYNQKMKFSHAFGTYGDMDIISTSTYDGLPQHGKFFVAFTGGGTDAISMELTEPLKAGENYTISFWDRGSSGYVPQAFQIGISNTADQFGTVVFTAGTPQIGVWTERVFTFRAPESAKYITVQLSGPNNIGDWAQADHFSFVDPRNSITTLKTSKTVFCACDQVEVKFTSSGVFPAGNEYVIQLSDASGSYDLPVEIGRIESSQNAGKVLCDLPCELAAGNAYRVRVISTTPAVTGTDNGENLKVNASMDPTVRITVDKTGEVLPGTLLTFTAQAQSCGDGPSFQWFVNGEPVGLGSRTYASATLSDGDVVSATVTSDAPCSIGRTAASNEIAVKVKTPPAPAVSIAADGATTIDKGESLTFHATPVNGGTNPRYQWKVNGVNVGTGTATFTSASLKDGDVISVVVTSSETYIAEPTAESNTIVVSVNEPERPEPVVSEGFSGKKNNKKYDGYYKVIFKSKHKSRPFRIKSRGYKPQSPSRRNIGHCHRF
jgi:hypothetical protein